jgi:hypothetical protein
MLLHPHVFSLSEHKRSAVVRIGRLTAALPGYLEVFSTMLKYALI